MYGTYYHCIFCEQNSKRLDYKLNFLLDTKTFKRIHFKWLSLGLNNSYK